MLRKALVFCFCTSLLTTSVAFADLSTGIRSYRGGDYATAFKEFTNDGSADAHFYLSMMYENGSGVRQDRQQSLAFLRSAAEKGLDVAQADLGMRYLDGVGVKADEEEGMKWLRSAADQGLAEAQAVLQMNSCRK